MTTGLDCIPCLIRQVIESLRLTLADDGLRSPILSEIMKTVPHFDLSQPPPVIAQKLHRSLRDLTGIDDPYRELKDRFNAMAVSMLNALTEEINRSPEPLLAAVKLAIAGNVIDCGAKTGLTESEVSGLIEGACSQTLAGDVDEFVRHASRASKIMYIADNAGEIVFDRPLIEELGPGRVTLAVRGFPVINDATIIDVRAAGLDKIVAVIENGSDAPGTVLEECNEEFRSRYNEADLVIAKGQGNYETLCDENKHIYFLLKIKCATIADHTGLPEGTFAVIRSAPQGPERIMENAPPSCW